MAEEITTSAANQGGAIGHIVRIVGPVVDVEFAPGQMPAIYNALTVEANTPIVDVKVLLEVQLHLPGDLVRAVAMSSTDGLTRGLEVKDTGNPMMMPVGPETLGRIWNVMGAHTVSAISSRKRPLCSTHSALTNAHSRARREK